ncbi:hypothetical protein BDP27DRAFT_14045 [Rhodocollybia butyracea]|uniref:Uncharacterized protein n=1 Tax=Rhodocollybia butyracea TaxID=206335 RepID=A0A9P5QCU5_9AGAR|nr:hypothetical protein BDP27DRAFT_14045 [Rhodocollybia butyracea]
MTTDNRLSPVSMERFGGLETSTHVEPFNTTAPSIPDATNLFDQGSALPSPVGDFDERRFSAVTTTSSRSSHFWQNERGETAVGEETQEKNPRDSMMTVQSTEQGDGDSESFRRFRDTLGSVNTFTSLPSYRTQPSASQTPYDFQLPPLPALPILPLPPPSAFTSARISRQLSPTTSRSNDPPPSYSL